jgi:hypothetical protein
MAYTIGMQMDPEHGGAEVSHYRIIFPTLAATRFEHTGGPRLDNSATLPRDINVVIVVDWRAFSSFVPSNNADDVGEQAAMHLLDDSSGIW